MNSFETGIAVGYLLKVGKKPKLTHMAVQASTSDNSWHTYNPPTGYDGFEYFRVKGIKEKQDEIERLTRELQEMEDCCEDVKDTLEEITGERPVRPEDIITEIEQIAEDEEEEEKENKIFETLYDKEPVNLISDADLPSNSAFTAGDLSIIIMEEWYTHPTLGYTVKRIWLYAIVNGQRIPATSLQVGTEVINSAGVRVFTCDFTNAQITFTNATHNGNLMVTFTQTNTTVSSGTTRTFSNYAWWEGVDYTTLGYNSAAEATAAYTGIGGTTYTPV